MDEVFSVDIFGDNEDTIRLTFRTGVHYNSDPDNHVGVACFVPFAQYRLCGGGDGGAPAAPRRAARYYCIAVKDVGGGRYCLDNVTSSTISIIPTLSLAASVTGLTPSTIFLQCGAIVYTSYLLIIKASRDVKTVRNANRQGFSP